MEVREARDVLSALGIMLPELEMLRPTESSYTSLLLQPSGPILASSSRIGGLDQGLNTAKVLAFARLARERGAHLAVAPEYFTPWSALKSLLEEGIAPQAGCLWVLGCESICEADLLRFKTDVAAVCEVIHEPLHRLPTDRELLDPVVLLFSTKRTTGEDCVVALVQFKTCPSRDDLFLEERLLRRGTMAYRFRGGCGTLSLVTLICSDAFAVNDAQVVDLVDRSTLIHIQLNPSPRNDAYRQYRAAAFRLDPKASDCHILGLNWARTIVQHDAAGDTEEWPAVGCSTWYLPKDSCAQMDAVVLPNHQQGLYYTYMKERRHALVFDYDEAVFECHVPKVLTKGPAILANRNGPSGTLRYEWNAAAASWRPQATSPNAGYAELLAGNPDAGTALQALGTESPLNVERLLALSAGAVAGGDKWLELANIDSFQIEADELVRRMTVVQDTDAKTGRFRHERLQAVANIRHELDNRGGWPPQIRGVGSTSTIAWDATSKPFNVHCDGAGPALVCYLGESPPGRDLEKISSKLTDLLQRLGGSNKKRLCVLYRQYGTLKFAELPGLTRFDDALDDEHDILKVDPN